MSDCEFCGIIKGEFEGEEIYQDDKLMAVLHLKPATPGQILIFTKDHYPIIEQVPDFVIGHAFQVSNKLSTALFESLNIQGTNIMINNGVPAGQHVPHFSVNIIPRSENDGLNLQWTPKQMSEEEMETTLYQLKEAAENIHPSGFEKEGKKVVVTEEEEPKKISEEENYLMKQLRRIP